MINADKIKDGKLQHDINREIAKISALSSDKIDKYEYLMGEELLSFSQSQMVDQANFIYSSLGKVFKKETNKQEKRSTNKTSRSFTNFETC